MFRKATIVGTLLCGICFFSSEAFSNPLVFLPFKYGEDWYCVQGQNGSYSHQGNQRYGYDFNMGGNLNSTSNPAFGKNLYAPITGTVEEIRDGVQDFNNNSSSNISNNNGWGNTIVILDHTGRYYVRLAHLKYGSIDHLEPGDTVKMGDYIGKVGQTGYSTSPHLHFQVMRKTKDWEEIVGDISSPFTFVEGRLYSGEWVTSGLSYSMSVIDNNNEQNIGNNFQYAYRYYSTNAWQAMNHTDNAVGTGYFRHFVATSNDNTTFSWRFRVNESGVYLIMATYPELPNNDPYAEYLFDGKVNSHRNQKTLTVFYKYMKAVYLTAGTYHTLSVRGRTPGTYVVADAVIVHRMY